MALGLVFIVLTFVQVITLIHFSEKSQREIIDFLGFVQYDDFSVTYPANSHSGTTKHLYQEYNKVIRKFRMLRTEKETNIHFFKSILQHIDIGIFAFNLKGDLSIINTSALRLLNLNRLENVNSLQTIYAELYAAVQTMTSHQKMVLKIVKLPEPISISISMIEIMLHGEQIKLVAIQNIQNELEEKEMEAWQNMIRVMTHEIMNSLTPITSLASTVATEMNAWHKNEWPENNIPLSETKDLHHAITTIQKRSEGLLHFVEDFRNLSQIPKPKPKLFALKPFVEELHKLLKTEFNVHGILFDCAVEPANINLVADSDLIAQVMINVLKNAIEAFDATISNPTITIKASYNAESRIEIWVQDNGSGIVEEVVEKVFIPFFSTKKTGSGIGLTISKQIMRMHKGTIKISSKIGFGTQVKLVF